MDREAVIYTDGSVDHNGNGGWAAIVATPSSIMEITGWEEETTNNRMEMRAALNGMLTLEKPHKVWLVSDSAYLLNTITHRWYERWFSEMQNGRKYQRPNIDLWKAIADLVRFHDVETVKVKGHDGVYLNEEVDRLAVNARLTKIGYTKVHKNGYPSS